MRGSHICSSSAGRKKGRPPGTRPCRIFLGPATYESHHWRNARCQSLVLAAIIPMPAELFEEMKGCGGVDKRPQCNDELKGGTHGGEPCESRPITDNSTNVNVAPCLQRLNR